MPKLALAIRAIQTCARVHAEDQRRPDFQMLAEELLELSLALRRPHKHPVYHGLIQIGSYAANWLADIIAEQGDTEIIEYIKNCE